VTQDFEFVRHCVNRREVSRGENTFGRARGKGTKVEEALKNLQGVPRSPTPRAIRWPWQGLAKYAKEIRIQLQGRLVEGCVITVRRSRRLRHAVEGRAYSKLLFL